MQRVLVMGSGCTPDSMEGHVVDALCKMGHSTQFTAIGAPGGAWGHRGSAIGLRLAGMVTREPERRAERAVVNAARAFGPTIVIVILGNLMSPKTIAALRIATQAPIVCWCQDQMTTLGRQYILGSGYDAVFVKDRYLQDLFSRMIKSTTFHYLAEACNPRVHRTVELTDADRARFECDVGIAASLYYYRQEILQQLSEFDLKVWGLSPGWLVQRIGLRHRGGEIFLDDKARAARAARIALNTLHFAEIDGMNCRTFELAGCGAFQLVTERPVLKEHFVPGQEIETFSSSQELIDKVRHYLKHPDQRDCIAARGQQRAHAEHTYEHRLHELLAKVFG